MPDRPSNLSQILRLDVPLVVRMGERAMNVAEVIAFAPGTIIELPKLADSELDLLVNNKQIGHGFAVKVGENFGVRITSIGDAKARVEAMAGTTAVQTPPGEPESESPAQPQAKAA